MNDKGTSFEFGAGPPYATLRFYQDINYKGRTLSFTTSLGVFNIRVKTLKSYSRGGVLGIGSGNWNDQASSLKIFM